MEQFQETRSLNQFPEMVARAEPDGDDNDIIRITGYGAGVNKPYEVFGFTERVAPGAFTKTLKENPDIRGMFNHDPSFLLGRTASGTMNVKTDRVGLAYEILADARDPQALSVTRKIQRGDVDGSSVAMFVHDEITKKDNDGFLVDRTLTEIELIETGPVTMPASPTTTAKIQRAIQETGIDYDALQGIMVRQRAGSRLSESDDRLIHRTLEFLEHLRSEPGVTHSDSSTSPKPTLDELEAMSEAAFRFRNRVRAQ